MQNWKMTPSFLGRAFFVGFLIGPLVDFLHVYTGTTSYSPTMLPTGPIGMPFWVPLLFGGASLAIGISHPFLDHLLKRCPFPGSLRWGSICAGFSIFFAIYAASAFLYPEPQLLKNLIVGAGALLIWVIFDRTWQGFLIGTLTAAAGVGVEVFLTRHDIFQHREQGLLGVAVWLPWLYFSGSIVMGNLCRRWLQKDEASIGSNEGSGARL